VIVSIGEVNLKVPEVARWTWIYKPEGVGYNCIGRGSCLVAVPAFKAVRGAAMSPVGSIPTPSA